MPDARRPRPRRRERRPAAPCRTLLLALCLALLAARPAAGQEGDEPAYLPRNRPAIGLALSGGGARGFAHIGVLRALDSLGVPVDVVAGTSMGSIVGGLYAVGYTPHQLAGIVRTQDWTDLFFDSTPKRHPPLYRRVLDDDFLVRVPLRGLRPALPSGLVRGHRIATLLARLTLPAHDVADFRALPIPFVAVATDLATGEAVRLDRGYLPQAIRASASFPSALNPVVIDGRSLIDGGIARNLPAEDARALGADRVVCVDAGEGLLPVDDLSSFVDVLSQAVAFGMLQSLEAQRAACDVYIAPDLEGIGTFEFGPVDTIIARGAAATFAHRAALEALVPPRTAPAPVDSVDVERVSADTFAVDAVRIEGVSPRLHARLHALLRLKVPGRVTPRGLETAVERIYATGLFEQVFYRLTADTLSGERILVLDVTERDADEVGLSLRFESRYKAAILLSARLTNRFAYGSVLEPSLRLGEVPRVALTYVRPLPATRLTAAGADVRWTRYPIDRFEAGERTTQLLTDAVEARVNAATVLVRTLTLTGGLWAEYYAVDRRIGPTDFFNEAQRLFGGTAELSLESFDRTTFPADGHRFQLRALGAPAVPGATAAFARVVLDWEVRRPLRPGLSLLARLALGHAAGDVPLHYRFYLGGTFEHEVFGDRLFPLLGHSTMQFQGADLQALWLGAQYRLSPRWFALARWNAGRTADRWDWTPAWSDVHDGFGLTLGGDTFLLPFAVTLAADDLFGPFYLHVNLGYQF